MLNFCIKTTFVIKIGVILIVQIGTKKQASNKSRILSKKMKKILDYYTFYPTHIYINTRTYM